MVYINLYLISVSNLLYCFCVSVLYAGLVVLLFSCVTKRSKQLIYNLYELYFKLVWGRTIFFSKNVRFLKGNVATGPRLPKKLHKKEISEAKTCQKNRT